MKKKKYFILLFPAKYFGFFFWSHPQSKNYFLKKAMYTIDNIIKDCEIWLYVFKILQNENYCYNI